MNNQPKTITHVRIWIVTYQAQGKTEIGPEEATASGYIIAPTATMAIELMSDAYLRERQANHEVDPPPIDVVSCVFHGTAIFEEGSLLPVWTEPRESGLGAYADLDGANT